MQFDAFTKRNIFYVTRQKENAGYTSIEEFALPKDAQHILKDERIEVNLHCKQRRNKATMRRVAVYSAQYQKAFVYITNNFELTAVEVAAIYYNRWQIEVFFKKK